MTFERDLKKLLDLLSQRGLLSPAQTQSIRLRSPSLQAQIKRGKERYSVSAVEVILAALGEPDPNAAPSDAKKLDEETLMALWAQSEGLPYLRIDPLKLDAKLITESINQAFARHNIVLPIEAREDGLVLAVDSPHTQALARTLQDSLRQNVHFVMASRSAILRSISEIYGFRTSVKAAASEQASHVASTAQMALGNLEQLISIRQVDEIDASDSHIVKAVDYLLNYALSQRASDIHIEPQRHQSLVRLRIDGVLHLIHKLPILVHSPIVSRLKSLARMDIAEKRRPQDGRLKTEHQGSEVELRVSTMPVAFGEKMVLRIFASARLFQELSALGLDARDYALFRQMLAKRSGLILVTGPTGSGKTTTLYSALKALYRPDINITTVEDPVEMVYEQFNQVQVQTKIGLSFHQALRTILRQDPDIIMVGEIRDEETAHMTVQAALTGHLVLSTLHTNDAPSAITRLLDLNVAPFLLASCLLGCLAQRLVRRVCEHCQIRRALDENELDILGLRLPQNSAQSLWVREGKGCDACRQTGSFGQTGIFEVMPLSNSLRRLIHKDVSSEALQRAARSDGMNTLHEHALHKLGAGLIPVSEVIRVLGLVD